MKIDLDDLERKANASNVGARWTLDDRDAAAIETVGTGCTIAVADPGWAEDLHLAHAEHIAANSPPVTLALIARIRELEDGLSEAARALVERHSADLVGPFDALIEKGAVLP